MSDAEAVKLVRDWLDSKEGTVDTKAIRRVCPDCDHNIECADRWKSEYDKLRASQSGSTAHRLAVLQEAAQYAVNRLDADKNQPQVAGDLSVALACSKAPLSAEQPNAQPQGPDLPGGDGVTRVTRTTAIRRDGTQSGPAAAAPFDKHCAICGQSLRPNCGETLCPIINATGGPCPVMEPASSGDVDTAMWVKVEEYNRVVSELHALRTRSSTGLTCPHGTIGYCEPCALVDPGELGETPPRLVHSSTGEPPQDWQDIFTEYARYGRSDAWLYQQIEAHSRRATRSAIALPVMELRAAALGLLQAWNKSEREGISVAEMAKARQRVDAAIRATAPSHTAPEAKERDPDALKKRQQPCTCTGACRGPEGLGEGWVCAMGRTVSPRVPKDGAV